MNYDSMRTYELNIKIAQRRGLTLKPIGKPCMKALSSSVIAEHPDTGRYVEFNWCENPVHSWTLAQELISSGHFITYGQNHVTCDNWHIPCSDGQQQRAAAICWLMSGRCYQG